jgi:hypothetical protein
MVTASIDTVGSVVAPKDPIVITGPQPRMTVEPALAPTIWMLTPTVKPPRYVPAATWIVSPLWAAATASAICEYGQPLGQTVSVAAFARPSTADSTSSIHAMLATKRLIFVPLPESLPRAVLAMTKVFPSRIV